MISRAKWIPLSIAIAIIIAFFYFHLNQYLNYGSLQHNRQLLMDWKLQHYILTVVCYILLYTLAVAVSFPGVIFFAITGGFLFGTFPGTLYVVFSIVLGSILLFLIVQILLSAWLSRKSAKWLTKMERGFQKNAFQYLLILRLIPIFPSWAITIVSSLLNIRLSTFVNATLLGVIPGAIIFTTIGSTLGTMLDASDFPGLKIFLEPQYLLPLLALPVLASLPLLFKRLKKR